MLAMFVCRARTFRPRVVRRQRQRRGIGLVSPLPRGHVVGEIPIPLAYEPIVMWRMRRADASCHAVIAPRSDGAAVVWFVNDRPLERFVLVRRSEPWYLSRREV